MRRMYWLLGSLVAGCHDAEQVSVSPDARACVSSTAQTGLRPVAIAASDVNSDGVVDIVSANLNSVSVTIGNGDGTFQAATDIGIGGFGNGVVVGDFNGDTKPDIAVAFAALGHGSVGVMLGHGDGTFGPLVPHPDDGQLQAVALAAGKFTSSGALDLAVTVGERAVAVDPLLGNGDGTFRHTMYVGTGVAPVSVVVADLDSDGNQDIVIGDAGELCIFNCDGSGTSGSIELLFGHGDGTFGPPSYIDRTIFADAVVTADVNGDGRLDIVATGFAPDVVYLGNGDGTFQSRPAPQNQDYSSGAIAVADLDGDGPQDIARVFTHSFRSGSNIMGTLGIEHGHGDGTFDAPVLYAAGQLPTQLAIADVNGNGRADVLVVNEGDSSVSVMLDGCFR